MRPEISVGKIDMVPAQSASPAAGLQPLACQVVPDWNGRWCWTGSSPLIRDRGWPLHPAADIPRHAVPVSGGVIVVLGGGTARQDSPCQPIKQPFPTSCLGRGERAVSCLPFLPPDPAFHLPRAAAGVSTGLACLRLSARQRQQLPQITAVGLKNGPLKQRRLTESASLYLARSESDPAIGPPCAFAPAACKSTNLHCTQSYVGKMSRGSRHPPDSPSGGSSSESSRLDRGTRDEGRHGRPLQKVIRKLRLLDAASSPSLTSSPCFSCFWFLVSRFLAFGNSVVLDSFQGSLDLQLCSNTILGWGTDHPLAFEHPHTSPVTSAVRLSLHLLGRVARLGTSNQGPEQV